MIQRTLLAPEGDVISDIQTEIGADYPDVLSSVRAVDKYVNQDHIQTVGSVFGRPCYNPGSVQGALHAMRKSNYDLAGAVRMTIRAGGCSCSRSVLIGALCGAKKGFDGIPTEWIEKTTQVERVLELALKVFH